MKILIINQPPFNRGDESAHKGLVRTLLKLLPDVRIRVISDISVQESVRQYAIKDERINYIMEPNCFNGIGSYLWHGVDVSKYGLLGMRPSVHKYKAIYDWADLVLCAPGGICMGGFQDWNHLMHLKMAQVFGKPLAYYGRSFGPFPIETKSNRLFKKVSLDMLHYFSFLSIRDSKTEFLADQLGIPYVSAIDSAFLDSPKVEIPYELASAIGTKPYMVFVPNYLLWHYAYKGRFSHSTVVNFYCRVMDIIWKANPELNILMLPQLFCGSDYVWQDVEFFRDLAKIKHDSRIIVTADCYSSDVQQTLISKAKYVIGARYHSIVFALNQGVPCIALSYEHKISGLLNKLGKAKWCIEFSKVLDSEINQEKCLDEIKSLIPNLQPDLQAQQKAKQLASDCMDKFIKYLLGGK